jgi:hypothetical protein
MPTKHWHDVSLNLVFGLLLSSGFDSILVVKDRLTKHTNYIPCLTTIDAPATAELFFHEIFRLHGLPKTIVSDRGPQFASKFWRCLFEVFGVDICISTAFHPETDSSTEVTNQVMEQYLCIFATSSKTIGSTTFLWQSLHTTTPSTPPPS